MNWDELADDISEAREGDRGGLGDPRRSGSRVGENRGSYTVRVGLAQVSRTPFSRRASTTTAQNQCTFCPGSQEKLN